MFSSMKEDTLERKKIMPKTKDGKRPRRAARPIRIPVTLPEVVDYKDIASLKKFLSERGKFLSRRFTGVSAKGQRLLIEAIKRARFLGLLPVGSSKRK